MAASRVAVVGAGLAGLAAGLELRAAGSCVEVFERSRLLGGRATSFHVDNLEVDNGQHVFLGCCTAFLDFVERLGMSDCLHVQDRFDALVLSRNGVRSRLRAVGLPPPWHLMLSFLGYRHLAWSSKLALLRALRAAPRACDSTTSFADWLAQCGQSEESLRSFWRPFFIPALNAPLEDVSAADGAFVLSTAFLSTARAARFGYAKVPLARVAERAAKELSSVHLNRAVAGLSLSRDGRRVAGVVTSDGQTLPFDAVVLAVTPPQTQRILKDAPCAGVPPLEGYVPYPIIDVHLWHDAGPLGFDFAAVLDSPLQWIFEKGTGYVCCSMSAAGPYLTAPTAKIAADCWGEVNAAVPATRRAKLLRSVVTRNAEATYLASAGQPKPRAATHFSGLAIAGSWTDTGWPDTMESAVRSGIAAARALAPELGAARVA